MDPRRRGSRTAAGLKRTGWRVPTAALERRNQHAHRRWHVRRRRFLGGGAFAQARRARGHRRIYEQLGGRGRKRRLHLGARLGRRARRLRPHRHSLLFGQFRQGVLRARVHALSRRIPPRPHAQPGRAVQPRDAALDCPRDQVFRLSALCPRKLGADKLATGHFARIGEANGEYTLLCAPPTKTRIRPISSTRSARRRSPWPCSPWAG